MTISRKYDPASCTLLLEGLDSGTALDQPTDARPLLSILTNIECRFEGKEQTIQGDSELFQAMLTAVSRYAQSLLSGIQLPASAIKASALVTLEKIEGGYHRLTVKAGAQSYHLDLTIVQLFDLVEAIDQFFADNRTLPDITLQLSSIPRRHVPNSEPLADRALPLAIGTASVAVAAIALFFVPVPEVQRPRQTLSGQSSPQPSPEPVNPTAPPSPLGSPSPQSSPEPESSLSSPSPSPESQPTPETVPETPASPSPTATEEPRAVDPEASLAAPEITDPKQLDQLSSELYKKLDQAWKTKLDSEAELVYRVGVGSDGEILGYKGVDDQSTANLGQTPLQGLLYLPTTSSQTNPEPIAQFRVVFKPNGTLEVSPWQGFPPAPASPSPTPTR